MQNNNVSIHKGRFGKWCFVDKNGSPAHILAKKGKEKVAWHKDKLVLVDLDKHPDLNVEEMENYRMKLKLMTYMESKIIEIVYDEAKNLPFTKTLANCGKRMNELFEKTKNTLAYYFSPAELDYLIETLNKKFNETIKIFKNQEPELQTPGFDAEQSFSDYKTQISDAQTSSSALQTERGAKFAVVAHNTFEKKKHSLYSKDVIEKVEQQNESQGPANA